MKKDERAVSWIELKDIIYILVILLPLAYMFGIVNQKVDTVITVLDGYSNRIMSVERNQSNTKLDLQTVFNKLDLGKITQ